MSSKASWIFLCLVILGVMVRVGFVLAADPHQPTFHSGGSDAPAYIVLAENLVSGKGFSYAGLPSAFRPPGYPLLLAAFMKSFGPRYISAVRLFQVVLGLLTVWICGRISLRLFGSVAGRATVVFGLFLPTLLFSTAQLLTECVSSFLTALFFLFLVDQEEKANTASAVGLGLVSGIESLIRFNAAALSLFAAWVVFRTRRRGSLLLRTSAVILLPGLLVLPWIIRNASVFPGHILYSTHGGANAVQGVVTTQGRTQAGDAEKLREQWAGAFKNLRLTIQGALLSALKLSSTAGRCMLFPSYGRKKVGMLSLCWPGKLQTSGLVQTSFSTPNRCLCAKG